jgi:DNA-binding MarR family transcriptional regulator
MAAEDRADAAERRALVEQLTALHQELERVLLRPKIEAIAAQPVTPQQLRVMGVLALGGPKGLADLAAALSVTPATISGIVDRLEHQGFATRSTDPRDARRKLVEVTPTGVAAIDALLGANPPTSGEFTAHLPTEDIRALLAALRVVLDVTRTAVAAGEVGLNPIA